MWSCAQRSSCPDRPAVHEVYAHLFDDPETGAKQLLLMQTDVTKQAEVQARLSALVLHEQRLLESIFPRHVIESLTLKVTGRARVQGHTRAGCARAGRASTTTHAQSAACGL